MCSHPDANDTPRAGRGRERRVRVRGQPLRHQRHLRRLLHPLPRRRRRILWAHPPGAGLGTCSLKEDEIQEMEGSGGGGISQSIGPFKFAQRRAGQGRHYLVT